MNSDFYKTPAAWRDGHGALFVMAVLLSRPEDG